jgi:Na+-transporting methylmalonyl-CoA/oxaloacetate decarboxylase gamma subunit
MYRRYAISPIWAVLFLVLFVVAMYYILKGLFYLLYFTAPIMLIALLVIDHKIFVNHFKGVFKKIRQNPAVGILSLILQVVGLPFVLAYLLMKALFVRKLRKVEDRIRTQREGEFVEFEDVTEVKTNIQLPRLNESEKDKPNQYNSLFD